MGLNDELSCFIDISAALSRSALNAANYDFREKESVYVRSNCFDQTRQELVFYYLNKVRKVGREKPNIFLLDIFLHLYALRRTIQASVWAVCYCKLKNHI